MKKIPVDRLKELLAYDAETGALTWIAKSSKHAVRTKIGATAGCLNGQGYVVITVQRILINAHQMAWALHYGEWAEQDIDHINCEKADNRISNLRLATNSQNHGNVKLTGRNKSGKKGVSWDKLGKKWRASIVHQGKTKNLGNFSTVDEAHIAYMDAANRLFKEFARAQ